MEKLLVYRKNIKSIWVEIKKIPNLIFVIIGIVWIITFVFRDANYWMTNITINEATEGIRLNTFAFNSEYITSLV